MTGTKQNNKKGSKIVRSEKADKLVETYHELGFVPSEAADMASASGRNWFAPVSFLPHVDYTISSVIGGY